MILIVTLSNDLHALAVQQAVRSAGTADCHIIECDRIAQREFMSFGINYTAPDCVLTSEGIHVSMRDATILWLRTMASQQTLELDVEDEVARAIIHNDCRGALLGYLSIYFRGKWISTPEATLRAADKIAQLGAALVSGFRIPKTLVSQSRSEILDFFASCSGNMIAKTIVGAPGPFLQTVKIEDPTVFDDPSFAAAPSIFQEYIPGNRHVRLNCFGQSSYAALIVTDAVDWRPNLNVPISEFPVDGSLHDKVRAVFDTIGLEMGIVDIKLTMDDEPVWLEVNPQGQFLFLDGLTKLRLAERFAAYLLDEHGAVTNC